MTRSPQAGFTLIELLIAMVIAGFVLAGTLKTANNLVPRFRVRQATRDVALSIRASRSIAIRDHYDAVMPIEPVTRAYARVSGTEWTGPNGVVPTSILRIAHLPQHVRFVSPYGPNSPSVTLVVPGTNDPAAKFTARGRLLSSNLPGYVYIGDPQRQIYMRVGVALAGDVFIERWENGSWKR